MSNTSYTLEDLERLSGFSGRTIRYYISQGLMPAPPRGCNATYGELHLKTLKEIAVWKAQNKSLDEIKHHIHGIQKPVLSPLPAQPPWLIYHPTSDVVLMLDRTVPPWRKLQVERLMASLQETPKDSEK